LTGRHDNIIEVFDSFITLDGVEICLCKTEKHDQKWFLATDLNKDLYAEYKNTRVPIIPGNCRTDKSNIYACDLKCKTRGIQIACNNCGVVVAYRELFGSESLTQVALMYLDLVDNYTSKYIIR
jgi:hypothetical protein